MRDESLTRDTARWSLVRFCSIGIAGQIWLTSVAPERHPHPQPRRAPPMQPLALAGSLVSESSLV